MREERLSSGPLRFKDPRRESMLEPETDGCREASTTREATDTRLFFAIFWRVREALTFFLGR